MGRKWNLSLTGGGVCEGQPNKTALLPAWKIVSITHNLLILCLPFLTLFDRRSRRGDRREAVGGQKSPLGI